MTDTRASTTELRRRVDDKNGNPTEEYLVNSSKRNVSTILVVTATIVIFILIVSIGAILLIDYYLRKSALKNKFLPRVHIRKCEGQHLQERWSTVQSNIYDEIDDLPPRSRQNLGNDTFIYEMATNPEITVTVFAEYAEPKDFVGHSAASKAGDEEMCHTAESNDCDYGTPYRQCCVTVEGVEKQCNGQAPDQCQPWTSKRKFCVHILENMKPIYSFFFLEICILSFLENVCYRYG